MNSLRVMNKGLKQNLLSFPNYTLNSEVEDVQTRIKARVGIALQYASQSWHHHLIAVRGDITDVVFHLRIFMTEKFLGWLEVVGVSGTVRGEPLLHWKS